MWRVTKKNESIEQTQRISAQKTNGTLSGAQRMWPKRDKYIRETGDANLADCKLPTRPWS